MPIASMVVEILDGSGERMLGKLARIPQVSVYGIKENQIVTVIEGESMAAVNETVREVSAFDEVLGVYPVSISEHDE